MEEQFLKSCKFVCLNEMTKSLKDNPTGASFVKLCELKGISEPILMCTPETKDLFKDVRAIDTLAKAGFVHYLPVSLQRCLYNKEKRDKHYKSGTTVSYGFEDTIFFDVTKMKQFFIQFEGIMTTVEMQAHLDKMHKSEDNDMDYNKIVLKPGDKSASVEDVRVYEHGDNECFQLVSPVNLLKRH